VLSAKRRSRFGSKRTANPIVMWDTPPCLLHWKRVLG
jgi:hypothetical protein